MSLFNPARNSARILVVQHSEKAPCGNIGKSLAKRNATTSVVRAFEKEALPDNTDAYDGLVVLGGPQHAFDDEAGPHFRQLMALMRRFDREEKPVVGICLGSQLLARAYGGLPRRLGTLEFGFVAHQLTARGERDPIIGGLPLPPLMEFHEDSFMLPPEATLLAEGERCRNQIFKVGNVSYGFQPHIEVDLEIASLWVEYFRNGGIAPYRKYRRSFREAFFAKLATDLETLIPASEKYCEGFLENWLALTARKRIFRMPN